MIKFIKKINSFLSIGLYPFVLDIERQNSLLDKYNDPKDLLERSYFQFKVQFDAAPRYKRILNNFLGFFAFFYFLVRGVLGRFGYKDLSKSQVDKANIAIFPYKDYHYPDVIPNELHAEFQIVEIDFMKNFYLGKSDIKVIAKIFIKNPFHFYFISKCVSKILFYRYILETYKPKAIISSSEYSFSSSVATAYLRDRDVEHINIMHGEKFFLIRDSFFEFDRFYIWDIFYKDLFVKLKAFPHQFRVGTFNHLKMNIDDNEIKFKYTYYLAAEQGDLLIRIKNSLEKLCDKKDISIRFHPRYSSEQSIRNIFNGFFIEDPKNVTLGKSFSNTEYVISLYSSCLTQAYFNNKNIVIDDINHGNEKLKILKDSNYIIFSKKHSLLSSLIELTDND